MKNYIKAMTSLTFDSAALTGGYDPFVATGLTSPCSILRIVNASNSAVGVSFDGVNTHEFLPAGGVIHLNFAANSRPNNKVANMAKGTNVCLIGAAGVGTIYLIGYYQEA